MKKTIFRLQGFLSQTEFYPYCVWFINYRFSVRGFKTYRRFIEIVPSGPMAYEHKNRKSKKAMRQQTQCMACGTYHYAREGHNVVLLGNTCFFCVVCYRAIFGKTLETAKRAIQQFSEVGSIEFIQGDPDCFHDGWWF